MNAKLTIRRTPSLSYNPFDISNNAPDGQTSVAIGASKLGLNAKVDSPHLQADSSKETRVGSSLLAKMPAPKAALHKVGEIAADWSLVPETIEKTKGLITEKLDVKTKGFYLTDLVRCAFGHLSHVFNVLTVVQMVMSADKMRASVGLSKVVGLPATIGTFIASSWDIITSFIGIALTYKVIQDLHVSFTTQIHCPNQALQKLAALEKKYGLGQKGKKEAALSAVLGEDAATKYQEAEQKLHDAASRPANDPDRLKLIDEAQKLLVDAQKAVKEKVMKSLANICVQFVFISMSIFSLVMPHATAAYWSVTGVAYLMSMVIDSPAMHEISAAVLEEKQFKSTDEELQEFLQEKLKALLKERHSCPKAEAYQAT